MAAIHDLLSELRRRPPAAVRWVIPARRGPPLPLESLRAGLQASEVRFDDLQFSLEEPDEIINSSIDGALNPCEPDPTHLFA